jgi:RHS repeat-associated protein
MQPAVQNCSFRDPRNVILPGQIFDGQAGLHYNVRGDYDPATGKYTESDPIGLLGGVNSYAYVGGDPMLYVDPLGLCWIFSQSTGQLTHANYVTGEVTNVAIGYSGIGIGLNTPLAQALPGIGPLPQGLYTIGPQQDNVTSTGHVLPASMRLTPDPGNQMFGRAGFLIHGPHANDNHDSSNGCPIFPKNTRDQIGNSDDKCFQVVQ